MRNRLVRTWQAIRSAGEPDSWRAGSAGGDEALIEVARVLKEERRETDLCCRYGGEEFVLLLDRTASETALAERIRWRIEAPRSSASPSPSRPASPASPSSTSRPPPSSSSDEALYEAKRAGRNRCLLDLGQGRYLDVHGTVHRSDDVPPVQEPPRIFA
ncbi:MAG: diguanylate cyclase [Acidobacteriota bacterium]|nr:diguanylate cyclase [Acidobacteriota bacterium]